MSLSPGALFDDEGFQVLSVSAAPSVSEETPSSGSSSFEIAIRSSSSDVMSDAAVHTDSVGFNNNARQAEQACSNMKTDAVGNFTDMKAKAAEQDFKLKDVALLKDDMMILMLERDEWKAKAEEHESSAVVLKKTCETLQDVVRGLETGIEHLKRDAQDEKLKSANEVEKLKKQDEERVSRLKDERKKKKQAKDALDACRIELEACKDELEAVKQEKERQKSISSGQSTILERMLDSERRSIVMLQSRLRHVQSNEPHLREPNTSKSCIAVVLPVEFQMHHTDFERFKGDLSAWQATFRNCAIEWYNEISPPIEDEATEEVTEEFEEWYTDAVNPTVAPDTAVGNVQIGHDMTYNEVDNNGDGESYIPFTGVENAGRRSRRGLASFSRRVQNRYNSYHSG